MYDTLLQSVPASAPRFCATIALFLLLMGPAHAAKTLEIYFIDVEGGQSTLVVSPSGQSLLIDTGWTGFSGRDADRVLEAVKHAHVRHLDTVLITHHHADHEGGVPNLLQRLTVDQFLDHGPTVETGDAQPKTYSAYEVAISQHKHIVVKPGDTIPMKGLEVTVLTAAGEHINRGGEANPFCAGIPHKEDVTENSQSVGILVQFGNFRFLDLGDLTWDKELALLCPENRVGKVDLYLTTHHGAESSKAIYALAPKVAIMNNGARKGGAIEGWRVVKASPGLEDMWQLHFAIAGGKQANVPDPLIANVDEQCEGKYLRVSASADGSFTVYNSRNKYLKTYGAK